MSSLGDDQGDEPGDDPVAVLTRWEASGAVWRVAHRGGGHLVVALLTCDGGEQVGEVSCEEDAVARFLAGRASNAD